MNDNFTSKSVYSVLACKLDYSFAINIFSSPDFQACVSVATTCYQNSSLSVFKIVDEKDNVLISYSRVGQV